MKMLLDEKGKLSENNGDGVNWKKVTGNLQNSSLLYLIVTFTASKIADLKTPEQSLVGTLEP